MTYGLSFRPLEPGDLAAVRALLETPALAAAAGAGVPRRSTLEPLLDAAGEPRVASLGAFEGATLTGLATLERGPRRKQHGAQLAIGVREERRGRGIGGALCDAMIEAADEWFAFTRLEVLLPADAHAARALLTRRGFQEEARLLGGVLRNEATLDAHVFGRLLPGWNARAAGQAAPAPSRSERAGTLQIRRATTEDAAALAQLHDDSSVRWGTLQLPLTPVETWRVRLAQLGPRDALFVATLDGALVGAAGVHASTDTFRAHERLLGMTVHTQAQGRGVGRALLQAAIDEAKRQGVRRFRLHVFQDNERAVRLYAAHGFALEGTLRLSAFRAGGFIDTQVRCLYL